MQAKRNYIFFINLHSDLTKWRGPPTDCYLRPFQNTQVFFSFFLFSCTVRIPLMSLRTVTSLVTTRLLVRYHTYVEKLGELPPKRTGLPDLFSEAWVRECANPAPFNADVQKSFFQHVFFIRIQNLRRKNLALFSFFIHSPGQTREKLIHPLSYLWTCLGPRFLFLMTDDIYLRVPISRNNPCVSILYLDGGGLIKRTHESSSPPSLQSLDQNSLTQCSYIGFSCISFSVSIWLRSKDLLQQVFLSGLNPRKKNLLYYSLFKHSPPGQRVKS